MTGRKQFGTTFSSLLRRGWSGATQSRQAGQRFHVERLEERCLMDGAGFIHTNPTPDPDSVVGVAGIEAQDDYVEASIGSQQLRIDVLANDPLPTDATGLHIKKVSETAQGATVAISEDGKRLVYTPPEGGVSFDHFYYIVEDSEGNLGKANVTVGKKDARSRTTSPGGGGYVRPDRFTVFEDSLPQELQVLSNDGPTFRNGEIIEVVHDSGLTGEVHISEDGKFLWYTPPAGKTGSEVLYYTVRNSEGETATNRVSIEVIKPFAAYNDNYYRYDIDTGVHQLNVKENDLLRTETPQQPHIVAINSEFAGFFQISTDKQHLLFDPGEDFIGTVHFSYTVRYGPNDYQTSTASGSVRVDNTFLAVDNWFAVGPGSQSNQLDVLTNDPTLKRSVPPHWRTYLPDVTLSLISVTAGSQGGQATISNDGKLLYTPAAGFTGEEVFTYQVQDSNGHVDSAQVTVLVADQVATGGVPKFILPGELEQFLIDQAVERYKTSFGLTQKQHIVQSGLPYVLYEADAADITITGNSLSTIDHSDTNTQEAGVDEADIVENDGQFVYTFSHGKLVIVDVADPGDPNLMSFTAFDDHYQEMYLQGDRLTLIAHGSNKNNPSIVTVLDIADRGNPTIVERTEIAGRIVDSRAVGDRVYVAVSGIELPALESHVTVPAEEGDFYEHRTNETLDEYVARVRATLLETALPTYQTFDGAGEPVAAGLLTDPTQIHKPIDAVDNDLMSLVTFDVADDHAGPDSSTGIFTSSASEVYMSGSSFYVLRNANDETAIFKFAIDDEGTATLTATGKIGGVLLNQFSVDEYDGRLRIATTETRQESAGFDRWGNELFRQQRRFNNLFILQQDDADLQVVGAIRNLAPTETIKSVRFLDERAYVTTFRVIDPLFTVDLSEPTNPTVTGALKIPGFSDYLHPVGEDYVIGIGRDANEITQQLGPLQISLFYVGDMAHPTLVDQVTMEGAEWNTSEAWQDHHAVAYFAEDQVLTIPIGWSESVPADWDGDGIFEGNRYENHSAIWAFEIDVDQQGGGTIEVGGSVEHETELSSYRYNSNQARRSVRVGQALVTLSDDYLKINRLHNVSEQLSEVYLGTLPKDDQFTVEEDSGQNILDVRANDRLGVGGVAPHIVSVTQPVRSLSYWNVGTYNDTMGITNAFGVSSVSSLSYTPQLEVGEVEIAEDGESLIFTPAENFFGTATFTYTVFDEIRGEQQATVTLTVTNTLDDPVAIDDDFDVAIDSESVSLNVLANDTNPDWSGYSPWMGLAAWNCDVGLNISVDSAINVSYYPLSTNGLTISEVGLTDHGGTVEIGPLSSSLTYTPAPGFEGIETFSYTITNHDGRTDTATVTIHVGEMAPPEIVRTFRLREGGPSKMGKAESAASLPYLSKDLYHSQAQQHETNQISQPTVTHEERIQLPVERVGQQQTQNLRSASQSVFRERAFAALGDGDLAFSAKMEHDLIAEQLAMLVG